MTKMTKMTNEEAIKVLNTIDNCLKGNGYDWEHEGIKTAIQALEKQIPKKPIITDFFDSGCCPNCERCISWIKNEYFDFDNCPYCGQAIDWSEE